MDAFTLSFLGVMAVVAGIAVVIMVPIVLQR